MLVKMLFGSHLYGLNGPNSDKDYKGIILPTKRQVLLGQSNFSISESTGDDKSKNSSSDVDTEIFSLSKFLDLARKGETVAIDMLHASKEMTLESSVLWDELVKNRNKFYTKNMKAYVGYVRKQAAKYGVKGSRLAVIGEALNVAKGYMGTTGFTAKDWVNRGQSPYIINKLNKTLSDIFDKLPIGEYSQFVTDDNPKTGPQTFYEICGRKFQSTLKIGMFIDQLQRIYDGYGERARMAKENEGIDWKAISHALRAGYQAKYIYKDGGFSYPLPETEYLKAVKYGQKDYLTEVQPVLEELVDEVMELAEESDYPEKADNKWIEEMIVKAHEEIVNAEGVYGL